MGYIRKLATLKEIKKLIPNPIEKKIEVHGFFTDLNERLKLPALADMFNYLALEHC